MAYVGPKRERRFYIQCLQEHKRDPVITTLEKQNISDLIIFSYVDLLWIFWFIYCHLFIFLLF